MCPFVGSMQWWILDHLFICFFIYLFIFYNSIVKREDLIPKHVENVIRCQQTYKALVEICIISLT